MLQGQQVLSFFRPQRVAGDWSQQELAEFYRVEAALVNSGISICTDRGLSDEGDPWFVFCRQDNDEVIVHFARIDGEYVIVSNLTDRVFRGREFNGLVRELLHDHPYILPKANSRRSTVFLHPAALLAALVVTGYVKSAEVSSAPDDANRSGEKIFGSFFNGHSFTTLSALVVAAVWDTFAADSSYKLAELAVLEEGSVLGDHWTHEASVARHVATDGAFDTAALGTDPFEKATHNGLSGGVEKQADAQASATTTEFTNLNSATDHSPSSRSVGDETTALNSLRPGVEGHANDWRGDVERSEQIQTAAQPLAFAEAMKQPTEVGVSQASMSAHGSSGAVASLQLGGTSDAISVMNGVYEGLHIDLQSVHLVALTAGSLPDALEATFAQFAPTGQSGQDVNIDPMVVKATATSDVTSGVWNVTGSTHNFDAAAEHAVEAFINHTAEWKIETFGTDILIVDTTLSHYTSNQFGLETWRMPDGSTISILGQAVLAGLV